MESDNKNATGLKKYLTPLDVWSMAIGTSIGWGSFVITGNTYLPQAGPLGSALGMLIGMAVMLIVGKNYYYMMTLYPGPGGAYTYTKKAFGYDHGFLAAWFLWLTYIAIFWANATSLPLFARYFLGDIFRFGLIYSLFGYDIYVGEVLLTVLAIILVALLCIKKKTLAARMLTVLALTFTAGIFICFILILVKRILGTGPVLSMSPGFIPDKSAISQVLRIASMSPWAFIGFENISHISEEFSFKNTKVFRILVGF